MPFIPKTNTLRKGILIYRKIRHRKGHGVHSPFVFNLITRVIEEKHQFYRVQEIEQVRKQLLNSTRELSYPDRHHKGKFRTRPISHIVEKEAVSPKQGALLFRLSNYFKCKNILQIGISIGLSPLYMTSWSKEAQCISLEQIPEFAAISDWTHKQINHPGITRKTGHFQQILPETLKQIGTPDLIYLNTPYESAMNDRIIQTCLEYAGEQTILVINGIHRNSGMRQLWRKLCHHPSPTVTLDLYHLGIVFFNKKLYKRNYINYF